MVLGSHRKCATLSTAWGLWLVILLFTRGPPHPNIELESCLGLLRAGRLRYAFGENTCVTHSIPCRGAPFSMLSPSPVLLPEALVPSTDAPQQWALLLSHSVQAWALCLAHRRCSINVYRSKGLLRKEKEPFPRTGPA